MNSKTITISILIVVLSLLLAFRMSNNNQLKLELQNCQTKIQRLKQNQIIEEHNMQKNWSKNMQTQLPAVHNKANQLGLTITQLSVDSKGEILSLVFNSQFLNLLHFLDELNSDSINIKTIKIRGNETSQGTVDVQLSLTSTERNIR